MSNKTIKQPKAAPQKAKAPGAGSPIFTQVSEEQKQYLASYPPMLEKVLRKVWAKFGDGRPFDINHAAQMEDQLVTACDDYLTRQFKGVLNLQEYVMLLGALGGLKAGMAASQGQVMEPENYHAAGQLFEASMRIMSESAKRQFQQQKSRVQVQH